MPEVGTAELAALPVSPVELVRQAAEASPQRPLVHFDDGRSWSCAQAWERTRATAAALRAAGLGPGDRLALFMPNGPEFLAAWWAGVALGSVIVPINTAYRGRVLERLLELARPRLLICADALRPRLADVTVAPGPEVLGPEQLDGDPRDAPVPVEVRPWDTEAWIMTSGTTGPSKLATVTYLHTYVGARALGVGEAGGPEVVLIDTPLFHMASQYTALAGLLVGGRLVVQARPALDGYWERMAASGATFACVLSTVLPYLLRQEPTPAERSHHLNRMLVVPLPGDVPSFCRRVGLGQITAIYGSTEVPGLLAASVSTSQAPGYAGFVRPGYEVRLVDEHELEVPAGSVGEALVRHIWPWVITTDYVDDGAATARAWRNGWFHTGDLFRAEPSGALVFVDRAKDALRRRAEMVSAWEVERAVAEHEGVLEVAVVAFPSDDGVDDDVKAWVVPIDGLTLDYRDLLEHCVRRLPHFMVPRYFELVDRLPKTVSAKVLKHELRSRGNSATTWDRQAHGLDVTRRGLESVDPASRSS